MKIQAIKHYQINKNRVFQPKTIKKEQENFRNNSISLSSLKGYYFPFLGKNKEIYAINKNRQCKKFNSLVEASKELGLDCTYISSILKGRFRSTKGYTFVYADSVETVDKNGNITLNKEKLKNIYRTTDFSGKRFLPIYAINENGNCKRYPSLSSAAENLNMKSSDIGRVLTGKSKTAYKYKFVYAKNVESKKEDGSLFVDKEALKQIYLDTDFSGRKHTSVYLIDKQGNYKRYNSIIDASKATGIAPAYIYSVTRGAAKQSKGYTFILASEVETFDEEGRVIINTDLINEQKIRAFTRGKLKFPCI